jgi:diketogulonate reductase-like aldo/keto reductase
MFEMLRQNLKLKNGHAIPVLGLGTWELEGKTCEETVRQALDMGYRHIDTAEAYGNEARIGNALQGFDRSDLFIVSKVSSSHLWKKDLMDACKRSLDRLATDYLDLYLVHWPNEEIPLKDTMDGMSQLVENGLVRGIGVSNFNIDWMKRAIMFSRIPIVNNQVEYHPYMNQDKLFEFCLANNAVLTAYSPLARGRVLHDHTLIEIGKGHGKSPAQVALKWLLQKGAVVIPKASSEEHLRANADMDDWELSPEEMEKINAIESETRLYNTTYT